MSKAIKYEENQFYFTVRYLIISRFKMAQKRRKGRRRRIGCWKWSMRED